MNVTDYQITYLIYYIVNFCLCFVGYSCFFSADDWLFLVRSIAEGAIFSLFTLTKPIVFRFGAIKSHRSMFDSHLSSFMCPITEWLSSAPAAAAPHVSSSSFAMILKGYLVMNMARFWGCNTVDYFNCMCIVQPFNNSECSMSGRTHLGQ